MPTPAESLRPQTPPDAQAGYSLIEALVALAVSVVLIIAVLNLFDSNTRMANAQNELAAMQQAQRAIQYEVTRQVRMAGRGGLQLDGLPVGNALTVRDNVGESEYIGDGDASTPELYPGTDVLIVRGAFSGPVYQIATVDGEESNLHLDDEDTPTAGFFEVNDATPAGIQQDLAYLRDAAENEALVLVDPNNYRNYAVVEVTSIDGEPDDGVLTVNFAIEGGEHTEAFKTLYRADAFGPTSLRSALTVAVLEEYRYYVRKASLGEQELPQLMRARVYPGTETPYAGDPSNWVSDLAENIYDFQVALGVDLDGNGIAGEGAADGEVTPDVDEWLFNHADDETDAAVWAAGRILDARITTLARVARVDLKYQAPSDPDSADFLAGLENHGYGTEYVLNTDPGLRYRRRLLPTVISLRNL